MKTISFKSIYNKLFLDKNGHIVLAQFPNAPLLVWLGAFIISKFVSNPTASTILDVIGTVALVVWAILEIYSGVNLFRKLLGAVVLGFIVVSNFLYLI